VAARRGPPTSRLEGAAENLVGRQHRVGAPRTVRAVLGGGAVAVLGPDAVAVELQRGRGEVLAVEADALVLGRRDAALDERLECVATDAGGPFLMERAFDAARTPGDVVVGRLVAREVIQLRDLALGTAVSLLSGSARED